jgi:uncharacterized alpha-E superfamily protein
LSNELLARYAECIFWLGRYVERAENLARIIDVNESFSRDSRGEQNWLSIVQLNADEKRFAARHGRATVDTVLPFYVTDAENPNSIISSIKAARENARTLRPLISTEMWVQLNVFYSQLRNIRPSELGPGTISRLCGEINEGTFFRDQAWYFYQVGRGLERADQTTRLLDIKYHLLLPRVSDVGSPIDLSQWQALLRSAAGYHAFRRLHTSTLTPGAVAGFLLHNPRFPRSVACCVYGVTSLLTELKSRYALRGGNDAAETLDQLMALLNAVPMEEILRRGLHEFIDLLQLKLGEITAQLSMAFFDSSPVAPEELETTGQ